MTSHIAYQLSVLIVLGVRVDAKGWLIASFSSCLVVDGLVLRCRIEELILCARIHCDLILTLKKTFKFRGRILLVDVLHWWVSSRILVELVGARFNNFTWFIHCFSIRQQYRIFIKLWLPTNDNTLDFSMLLTITVQVPLLLLQLWYICKAIESWHLHVIH